MEMDKVITISYRWTVDEWLDANTWATTLKDKKGFGGLFKWILGLMLAAFVFMNLVVIFVEYTWSSNSLTNIEFWKELLFAWGVSLDYVVKIFALFLFVFGFFWISQTYITPWLARRNVEKGYSGYPGAEKTFKITIDDEAIAWEIGDELKMINKWQVFSKVVKTKGGFYFYDKWNSSIWMPNHAFKSKEEMMSLGQLVQDKSISYEEIQ